VNVERPLVSTLNTTAELNPALSQAPDTTTRFYRLLTVLVVAALPFAYLYAGRLAANPDPYTYAQYGKQFLAGEKLYTEIAYDKGPLVPVFYAIPQLFVARSSLAVAYFGGLVIAVQALMFAWAFRTTPRAAFVCAATMLLIPLSYIDWYWFSTEHATNLFVVPSLLICLKICRTKKITTWDAIWTGVLPVLALNTRQPTVMLMLAPTIILCTVRIPMRERVRALLIALGSGAVTLGLVLIFVVSVSDLKSYYYFMVEFPQKYRDWPPSPVDARMALISKFFQHPFAYVTVLLFIGGMMTRYRVLVLASLISGLAMCFLPRKDFQHYLVSLFPSIVLWTGVLIEQWKDSRRLAGIAMALVLVGTCGGVYRVLNDAQKFPTAMMQEEVSAKVDQIAPPGATLTVWGPRMTMMEPVIFASKLPSANKVCWMFMLRPPFSENLVTPLDQTFQEYLTSPPRVAVVHEAVLSFMREGKFSPNRHDVVLLRDLMAAYSYEQKASVNRFVIFLRKDGPPPSPAGSLYR